MQLYKNNARALLSRILSILNLDWLQHARSVREVYEVNVKAVKGKPVFGELGYGWGLKRSTVIIDATGSEGQTLGLWEGKDVYKMVQIKKQIKGSGLSPFAKMCGQGNVKGELAVVAVLQTYQLVRFSRISYGN